MKHKWSWLTSKWFWFALGSAWIAACGGIADDEPLPDQFKLYTPTPNSAGGAFPGGNGGFAGTGLAGAAGVAGIGGKAGSAGIAGFAGTAGFGAGSGGAPTCSHDVCVPGAPLNAKCNECTSKVCAADPFCCKQSWDQICVNSVGKLCGISCGSSGAGGGLQLKPCEPYNAMTISSKQPISIMNTNIGLPNYIASLCGDGGVGGDLVYQITALESGTLTATLSTEGISAPQILGLSVGSCKLSIGGGTGVCALASPPQTTSKLSTKVLAGEDVFIYVDSNKEQEGYFNLDVTLTSGTGGSGGIGGAPNNGGFGGISGFGGASGKGGTGGKGGAGGGTIVECGSCAISACQKEALDCLGDKACSDCFVNLSPFCIVNQKFAALYACSCQKCSTQCKALCLLRCLVFGVAPNLQNAVC